MAAPRLDTSGIVAKTRASPTEWALMRILT
jgi:hypothetical protein